MKVLLVYPSIPSTFWSFDNALSFISKKTVQPPLGLITIASMLPDDWELKLIDMNISPLEDNDILWADMVFLSGMSVQRSSFKEVASRCRALGLPVVAGGPMVTTEPEDFPDIDHLVLNEAEITLPEFLADLKEGKAKRIYRTDKFPNLEKTPPARYDLLDQSQYATMSLQYSRGCPFDCEFCNITALNGRKPRVKSTPQFLNELENIYRQGWRGEVFIVDDNLIGRKNHLKKDFLPALIRWCGEKNWPFHFTTEVSMNLADDEELIDLMVRAGFDHIFIGIETPNEESLAECGKLQNKNRDMASSVRYLQKKGLRVSGGFIVGFDNDPPNIFERQIKFIKQSGIVTAMVGLLNAPSGSKLFKRMEKENRLKGFMSGDNTDFSTNFIPKMNEKELISGYRSILDNIYSPDVYYRRVKLFIKEFRPFPGFQDKLTKTHIKALFKSIWILGVKNKGKRYYWKLFFISLLRYPRKFSLAITMAIYGFHFREIYREPLAANKC